MHANRQLFWIRNVIIKQGKNKRSLHKLFYGLTEIKRPTVWSYKNIRELLGLTWQSLNGIWFVGWAPQLV